MACGGIVRSRLTPVLQWQAKCVRDTYGIEARFTHVDNDMAEIGMLKDVWNAKISLYWWVRIRLASGKLSTTPYYPGRAHAEFSFIDIAFVPAGQADGAQYEGGVPDLVTPLLPASVTPVVLASQQSQTLMMANGLRITIPARAALVSAPPDASPLAADGKNELTARGLRPLQETSDNGTAAAAAPARASVRQHR
ncbi:hypothetical protein B0H17DRAFT_1147624 [Mycena rosella]|uniref:Uncharacterized protein n=1 Tax=Mycena rosella TaxID=1033263 RepID=A0AAD7CLD4_MYCRO|nr:hypothetical protein B0H17DRAFT_1147624 [Mycena rosella]